MKALRKSLKGEKDKSPHVSIVPKIATAIVPPKKVIRALYDYEAQSEQELSFSRGDFFHVISRENDAEWYEACNPALPDARGLVPVSFFQALGRTERDSSQSQPDMIRSTGSAKNPDNDSGYGDVLITATTTPAASARSSKSGGKTGAMVYGIVMYDFQAERADELEAKAGEAIIVIAQSNPEWFVAKPIGRLGGPGLIPVSFVEIRDMATNTPVLNPQEAIRRAGIPKVEEWKRMAADYKNSSITLGKFDVGGVPQSGLENGMERMSLQGNGSGMAQPQQQQQYQLGYDPKQQRLSQTQSQRITSQNPYPSRVESQLYAPISAQIPRYCFAEDKYWFVIVAQLEDGRAWELSRYYEDFYDFQIALLREFTAEAGNVPGQKRTLPYMPGPVNYVTDAITEGRLHNLDAYVKNLLQQPPYISRCNLVKQFFAPREGDYEIDPAAISKDMRMSAGSELSSRASQHDSAQNHNGHSGLSVPNPGQPNMQRQVSSSFSQPSQNSSPALQQAGSTIKVKLNHHGDIVVILVSADIHFNGLYERILKRYQHKIPEGSDVQLSYKDETSGVKVPMVNDHDLDMALQRNEKLLIYVE